MNEMLVIRVDSALKERLTVAARDDDRTLSNFVRRTLNQAVATVPAVPAADGEQ